MTLIGLLITVILYVRKVPGALIISILLTAAIGLIIGFTEFPTLSPPLRASPPWEISTWAMCSRLWGSSPQR